MKTQNKMKKLIYLVVILALFACDDTYEDLHRYTKIATSSKQYPVFLDMSEVGKIQVKASEAIEKPFKITSNDNYVFVGEMMKGIHVFQKSASKMNYVSFIECQYMKSFEVIGDNLFCNNFLDLVVIDVKDAQKAKLVHRQKYHFNRYTSYKVYWNFQYIQDKGPIMEYKTFSLTDTISDKQPMLDFSEYDKLYDNLTTTEIPNAYSGSEPEFLRPYVSMIKHENELYTLGQYNSWAICTYRNDAFSMREVDLWYEPKQKYAVPYYYSNAFPYRLEVEDEVVYHFGKSDYDQSGYVNCNLTFEKYSPSLHFYFPDFLPIDASYSKELNAFFVLAGNSIWGAFLQVTPTGIIMDKPSDFEVLTDANNIYVIGDKLIATGKKLTVYQLSAEKIELLKDYPGISGLVSVKEGNILTMVHSQELKQYDITDLENIKLIQ